MMRKSKRAVTVGSVANCPEYLLQMAVAGEFDHLPDEVRQALESLSPQTRRKFLDDHFNSLLGSHERELVNLIISVNPLTLLALLTSVTHLQIQNFQPERRIGQVHVELAQLLTLRVAPPHSPEHPSLENCSRISTLLLDYHSHAMLRRSPALQSEMADVNAQRRRIAYVTSAYFGATRSWAYPQHIEQVFDELVLPLEGALCERLGYRLSTMFKMWRNVRRLIFQRLEAIRLLRDAVTSNARDRIRLALDRVQNLGLSKVVGGLREHTTPDARQSAITAELAEVYKFSLDELREHAADNNLPTAALKAYLLDQSITFGEISDQSLEDALLQNPVWARPVIAVDDTQFFVGLPDVFEAFVFSHAESAFSRAGLGPRYEKRRARYLEDKVESLLRGGLPSATIIKGTRFKNCEADGENDLLVRVGNWLLIIESKSHKLTGPAQRGVHARLRTNHQEQLV
jgi:hypothetical protein